MAFMSGVSPIAAKIHEHLKDATTRQQLKNRFTAVRDQLTTSIGEAAKLANVSAEKARYAESIGILTPGRSDESKGVAAHRRYTLGELNRLVVMGNLIDNGFSMNDIASYLRHERASVDALVESLQVSDPTTRLQDAETAYRQRMLYPRLLYFTQCLLLGDVVDCSMAIVLPVEQGGHEERSTVSSSAKAPRSAIDSVEDLPQLGPSLVGWRLRGHPYCVLYMSAPRMDDATRYVLYSVDALCRDAGVNVEDFSTGAYLLVEREFARRFSLDTTPISRPRLEPETKVRDKDKTPPNSRAVAHRLLRRLRLPAEEANHIFGHSFATDGDGMIYNAPEFVGDMTGDRVLTDLANLVVELGTAPEAGRSRRRAEWIFSAILLPDDPSHPISKQGLVVTVQSRKSPHIPGVTRLNPGSNAGLSTAAALSGHMLLRQVMDSTDAAIADAGVEGDPGPALAMPILSMYGRMLAVLYVRAAHAQGAMVSETFTVDDQLLLRILGYIIGGIVFTYQGSELASDVLSRMIAQPRTVDRFFQEFPSANSFWQDLGTTLHGRIEMARTGAINPLTLIAIDIDGYTDVINTHGLNTARHLVRAVGKRLVQKIKLTSIPALEPRPRANLYYIYGDRFYLLLEGSGWDVARIYARDVQELLTGDYAIEVTRTNGVRAMPVGTARIDEVRVRIVIISYEGDQLSRLIALAHHSSYHGPHHAPEAHSSSASQSHEPVQNLVSEMTTALDAGIIQAKQNDRGVILYLDVEKGLFRRLDDADEDQGAIPPETRPPENTANGGELGYTNGLTPGKTPDGW
jgi:DNA-binding transcriptional MerR regulator/GGDEF domain-containing protein